MSMTEKKKKKKNEALHRETQVFNARQGAHKRCTCMYVLDPDALFKIDLVLHDDRYETFERWVAQSERLEGHSKMNGGRDGTD